MPEETPEEYIKNRVAKLESKKAFDFAWYNPELPIFQREKNRATIESYCENIESLLPQLELFIKRIFTHMTSITEQTKISAVYLLIGKSFSYLQTTLELCKRGKNLEAMELSRSSKEALDLCMLFWDVDNKHHLEKWFKGKIIENSIAREYQHKILNRELKNTTFGNVEHPIDEMLKEGYKIMSLYTHSAYSGILDSVDVYKMDIDYDGCAGFHYSVANFHIIQDTIIKILLQLKNSFLHLNDKESLMEVDGILESIRAKSDQPTPEELKENFKRFNKPTNK